MNDTTKVQRPGREFWDKLNALPRYMFLLKPSDAGIQKLEDPTGNWIDVHEAQQVVDQAQEENNKLRAERDALQLRLNASDQQIYELTSKSSTAERERLMEIVERYPNGDPLEYSAAIRKIQQ